MPLAAYLIPAKENAEDPAYRTVLWNFSSFACKIESDSELLATLERGGDKLICLLKTRRVCKMTSNAFSDTERFFTANQLKSGNEIEDNCERDEFEQRLIIIATGGGRYINALFNSISTPPVSQIALSHDTDVDTLDRSAIRFGVSRGGYRVSGIPSVKSICSH